MKEFNWDLSLIYNSDESIQKDMKKIEDLIAKFSNIKSEKNISLEELLKVVEEASVIMSRLIAYSNMKRDEDTTVSKSQKTALEVEALSAKMSEEFSSFEPIVMSTSEEKINDFMKKSDRDDYKQIISRTLRNKPYVLSEKEEYLLSMAQDIASDTENSFYMLSYADMRFPVIESDKEKRVLTHANYSNFQTDPNRQVRKESFEKMYETYGKYVNTFAADYYGHVKAKEKLAKARNFKSNLSQELFGDNVDEKVYDTLIEAIHDYIPVLSKYMDIKKKYLGVDEIHNYDLYVPLFEKDETKYRYEEAEQIIKNALKPLGEEYLSILKKGFEDRWIDVYPKEGKKAGAYSFGAYDTNPYILMNYTDNLNSVFTLAHELGHSIHSYYSRKNNPFLQSDYTIFVAEVASTTNELLLYNYMLKNADTDIQKKNLMVYNMEQFRTTVFRQVMFAEFEKIVHDEVLSGKALTAESLNEIYYNLNKTYYPTVKLNDEIALEWARIPHFYSDYYVYKYATGFTCATFLSQAVLKGAENVNRYINFLKDGNKNYPIDQLKIAGVDISKKETICQALDVFKDTLDKF